MMDMISKIDELIESPAFLIDIFPKTVPPTEDNRYFEIEEYFQRQGKLSEKCINILLKLYCYYDFVVVSAQDKVIENPIPNQLVRLIKHCFKGNYRSRDYINIVLPECNSMIQLHGGNLYMVLYNPNEHLKELVSHLAQAEGLFFYKAPADK